MVFLGRDFVITVRHGDHSGLHDVRRRLEADPEQLALGPAAVLHAIADHVVDGYLAVTEAIEDDIDDLEREVFTPRSAPDSERIYAMKREVLELRRAVVPLGGPVRKLTEGYSALVPHEVRSYFRNVDDHLVTVTERIASFNELLTSLVDAALAKITMQQNGDMRKITSWVAIVSVPTMTAGIYGMNFDEMPALHWNYGFSTLMARHRGGLPAAVPGVPAQPVVVRSPEHTSEPQRGRWRAVTWAPTASGRGRRRRSTPTPNASTRPRWRRRRGPGESSWTSGRRTRPTGSRSSARPPIVEFSGDRGEGQRARTEEGGAAEELLAVHGSLYHATARVEEPDRGVAGHIEDGSQGFAADVTRPADDAAFEFPDVVGVDLDSLPAVGPDVLVDQLSEFLPGQSLGRVARRRGALACCLQLLVRRQTTTDVLDGGMSMNGAADLWGVQVATSTCECRLPSPSGMRHRGHAMKPSCRSRGYLPAALRSHRAAQGRIATLTGRT